MVKCKMVNASLLTPICLSSQFYLHDLADDHPCIICCTVLHGDGVLCKKLYSNDADNDLLRGQHHFVSPIQINRQATEKTINLRIQHATRHAWQ
jgi:hypothetical protein